MLSAGILFLISHPSTTIYVLHLDTLHLVCFSSRTNFKGCLKTKACQNSVCSHYCLIGQNYRPEMTFGSAFSVGTISAFGSVAVFSTCSIGDTAGNKTF